MAIHDAGARGVHARQRTDTGLERGALLSAQQTAVRDAVLRGLGMERLDLLLLGAGLAHNELADLAMGDAVPLCLQCQGHCSCTHRIAAETRMKTAGRRNGYLNLVKRVCPQGRGLT